MGKVFTSGSEKTPLANFKKAGDFVKGKLTNLKQVATKYGPKLCFEMRVEDADCEITLNKVDVDVNKGDTVSAFATKSLAEIMLNAKVGDTITVKLAELVSTGKGNPFKSFSVEVE